ncbi:TetR/AcrR family transcriptional regulator [Natrialba sp. SSL1]|uniref:TetR/AcrR family transcriptional regulator n=1 Tax=Natrialba sp. SSL1 TaxID=1869245 RepID=UPI0008F87045|nr:TetR/AcrR family transcriptional regulator [Natrialba sp. SSL1]OIB56044.1 transcriptional regulator [Natrialba sp. SSL1]
MNGFSDEERKRIREELIESGRDLFVRYGLERTRIKDITDEVGIGTSTFYQFFDSKELLYAEVLYRELTRFETDIEEEVMGVDDPHEQVRTVLQRTFEEVESNPIIHNLIIEDEIRALQTQLSDDDREYISEKLSVGMTDIYNTWVNHESFKYDDPEVVNELFRSLVFMTHRKDLARPDGETSYDQIRDTLIDVVVDGLFDD